MTDYLLVLLYANRKRHLLRHKRREKDKTASGKEARAAFCLSEKLKTLQRDIETKNEVLEHLESVCPQFYAEVELLTKKKTDAPFTRFMTQQLNELITDIRTIGEKDRFIDRIRKFESAGNEPENREVLIIMGKVLRGLDKLREELEPEKLEIERRISEADLLVECIEHFLVHDEILLLSDITGIESHNAYEFRKYEFNEWFEYSGLYEFSFDRLDEIDIDGYFGFDE